MKLTACAAVTLWILPQLHVWGDPPVKRKTTASKAETAAAEGKPGTPTRRENVYQILLRGTAFLEAAADDGSCWHGTGWVWDRERRLIVTNRHVTTVDGAGEAPVLSAWFPVIRDGEAIHELDYYVQNVPRISVSLIYADDHRDLALVRADSLPDKVGSFALADRSAPTGAHLHSLAGLPRGSQGLFIYSQGTSRAVYRREIATGGEIQVLETQMPLNKGNSGGPVVNDQGQLVAVFEGLYTDPGVQLVNMCIDISEVRRFVKEAEPLIDPKSAAEFNERGDLHYESGRYRLALADYNQALKLDPQFAEAVSNRGWVHYQNEDLDTALAEFDEALKLDPKFVDAHWGRGCVYRDQARYRESTDDFTQAIRAATSEEISAQLYNERGNTYYSQEDFEAALADYGRAIKADPALAWGHANRGDALAQLNRYDEALAALDRAIELEPRDAQFWNLAGNIWFRRERYDFAVNMYSRAMEHDPKNGVLFRNRGVARRHLEQFPDAIADLLQSVELIPIDHEHWNQLALTYLAAGQYPHAVNALTKALELTQAVPEYFANRGDAYLRVGSPRLAVEDLSHALEMEDNAAWRVARGNAYQALGESASARADFQRATEMDDDYDLFDRKYIKVVNDSGEKLEVHLQYFTRTTAGQWKWFPTAPGEGEAAIYTFTAGESAVLYHEDWKVNASRIRLWAYGESGGSTTYRDTDLVLVPEGGYLSDDGEFETFVYTFFSGP